MNDRTIQKGSYIVSTDSGGTFVDAVILDEGGSLAIGKSPTTPEDPAVGIIAAVGAAAARAGLDVRTVLGQCAMFLNGTTVTTNAMIQRTGAKTGLIMTRGFEDTLIIGRVRSRWVGLDESALADFKNVERPAPVVPTSRIRGVPERIDCFGKVVVALDLAAAEKAIDELVSTGIESLAVCLLWSFKNPEHEAAIVALARRKYPSLYVVASSQLVQSMGEYERANTAAVDAYLGPTLNKYLAKIGASLHEAGYGGELLVMQSIGGLSPASGLLQAAVTTLQSGPAGGIIAAQKLGQLIGEPNVITADMGGTTFDVGIVVDDRPQTAKTSVMARNLLLVPALEAISIGAGGGSIAWLDSANALHVGPRSQGARPGPACYDRGGTLPTVTDADVILGYINPDRFLGGGMQLRADLAHQAVKTHIADPLGISVEAAAQAIYDIVNAHMADLVRSVTVGRGFDPRDFTVVAFGGCGPTHCTGFGPDCQPRRIVVPPAATVLSAFGIAQSDIKHFHTRTFVRPVGADPAAQAELLRELNNHCDELIALTTAQFEREGIPPEQRTFVRSIDIRYRKQVHELTIPIAAPSRVDDAALASVIDDFVRTYERIYGAGSSIGKSSLEFATLRVEGIAKIPRNHDTPRSKREGASPMPAHLGRRKVWWKRLGGFHDTDAFQLEKLACGNVVDGPAIIESYGTSIPLHPGQQAHVDEWLNLIVEMSSASIPASLQSAKSAQPTRTSRSGRMTEERKPSVRFTPRTDPTTFEVLRHRLWQINDEQGKTLLNMSGSQIATEANDFNVGISDAEGNLIVVGPYILVQMAPLTLLVQSIIRTAGDNVIEGDVFLCNDPWFGAVHQNDVCVLAPFFWKGKVTAWTASVVHQVDVGGPTPGSWCREATDTFQEAPRYRFLRVVRGGVLQQEVVDTYLTNSRTPDLLDLDLRAQIGSAKATLGGLNQLFNRYGDEVVLATMHDMLDYAECLLANKLETIPSGEWLSDCYLDHDGHGESTHRYALRLRKDDTGLTFDYTETDPQIPAFINCAYGGLFSATYIGVLVYLCADIPWNSGVMRRVRILSHEGTLNNARYPAAVSGSLESIWNSTNAACAALGKMLCASDEERSSAMAVWQGSTLVYTLFGTNQYGERYGSWMISSSLGGAGARSFGDGHDNSGPLMAPCYSAINVEHAESLYPMLFLYRKRAEDSGGPGKWRGGVSADHAITPHGTDEIAIGVTSSGADHSHALGLVGGYPGAGSTVRIARAGMPGDTPRSLPANWHEICGDKEVLAPKGRLTLKKGDVFSTIPHGGGGFGDPLDRDPQLVLRDVVERVVSVDGARDYYAVVVTGDPLHVDHDVTAKLRVAVRRGRIGKADDAATPKSANGGAQAHLQGSGIVKKNGHWACSACENALGPVANNAKEACAHQYRPLAAAGPLIAPRSGGESRKFRLSEYSCPNCGTLLAVDQTLKTAQTHWHDVRPA